MPPTGLSWEVTSVQPDQTINTDANQTVVGAYVYFKTGHGNSGNVFIPNNQFNKETVAEKVRAAAKQLDEISRLSEGKV